MTRPDLDAFDDSNDIYGVEIKIDSLERDGMESWVVISRGIERYVTELLSTMSTLCTLLHALSAWGKPEQRRCIKVRHWHEQ